jgi:DOPA 4,5-dioxygenase
MYTIGISIQQKPVGPHPKWSYQLLVNKPENFRAVYEWLVLNHGPLDILVHPLTDNELRDHIVSASFIGHSHPLVLGALLPSGDRED